MASSNLVNKTTVGSGFTKKYSVTLADLTANVAAGSTTSGTIVLEALPAGAVIDKIRTKHNVLTASGTSSTITVQPNFTSTLGSALTLMTTGTGVAVGSTEGTHLRTTDVGTGTATSYYGSVAAATNLGLIITVSAAGAISDITAFGVDVYVDWGVLL